jgi:peptide chain release factor 2
LRGLMHGADDPRAALVTIRAGAGGIEAADFAHLLLLMYLRWAEWHGQVIEVQHTEWAHEIGISSVTFAVRASYAFGMLSGEAGVHRLVRVSPFDREGRRHTSFAAVHVVPAVTTQEIAEFPDGDLRVEWYCNRGVTCNAPVPGLDAVRVSHLPSGIVVNVDSERAASGKLAVALANLTARLRARERWAEPAGTDLARSYVLHPQPVVKDLRTGAETTDATGFLDGNIDAFVEAGIRWRDA